MVLLDTNIVIGYLAQDPAVVKKLDAHGSRGDEFALGTQPLSDVNIV